MGNIFAQFSKYAKHIYIYIYLREENVLNPRVAPDVYDVAPVLAQAPLNRLLRVSGHRDARGRTISECGAGAKLMGDRCRNFVSGDNYRPS